MPVLALLPLGKDQVEIETLSYAPQYLELPCHILNLYFYSMDATLNRFKQGQDRPDLFSHFVQEDGKLHPNMTMKDLSAEVRAMIIAGGPLHFTNYIHEIKKVFP